MSGSWQVLERMSSPLSWPLFRASTTAGGSQMAPRALLTRKEPFFIFPMVSLLNMCLRGQCKLSVAHSGSGWTWLQSL